ncbi:MAG: HDIG domain-containing metalloprotein [Phycisphaerales bacterium]
MSLPPHTPLDTGPPGTPTLRVGSGGSDAEPGRRFDPQWLVRSPAAAWNVLVLLTLALVLGLVIHTAGRIPKLAPDMVLDQARVVRAPFTLEDKAGTESRRQAARLRSPRVYVADPAEFESLLSGLDNLPRALIDAANLAEVDPQIRARFDLTADSLATLKMIAKDPGEAAAWSRRIARLITSLRTQPLVEGQSYQREALSANDRVQLIIGEAAPVFVPSDTVLDIAAAQTPQRLRDLAAAAGLDGPPLDAAAGALIASIRPTFRFDQPLTEARAAEAAKAVRPLTNTFVVGQPLALPGEVLTAEKVELLRAEHAAFRAGSSLWTVLARDLGLWGAAFLAALGLGAYAATYAPRLWGSPARVAAVASLVAVTLGASCLLGTVEPRAVAASVSLPPLLLTIVLAIAYDRRTALALGSLIGILACVALEQPVATIGIALSGVWMAAWRLREFRNRQTLVRAGLVSGVGIAIATLLLSGLQRPMVGPAWWQTLIQAAQGGAGAVLVSLIVLGSLPLLERIFDTVTGMSLIELRDPQHPLQRLLQQQAPGTYSHSLNVAGLAEAAAQAIGADGLTTYVGALYHDVGKATKPEYFVENQSTSFNRHDRLAPAMSLLVIVGHVKEGLELARRAKLPKILHHFIESHHGTTLVEYFYHRARKQAESGARLSDGTHAPVPQEIEYRYPGPKPRTREAAIVMVCDAAESATRSLPDPSPARIEGLVRAIAHKRLTDGQFDDCDLSLRDLAVIIDTVSRTLAAIFHPRIAYPDAPPRALPATGAAASTLPPGPITGIVDAPPAPRRETARTA